MSVCVIIQRKVEDKKIASQLAPLIVRLRSQASIQPGYIWDSMDSWNNWKNSEQRQSIQKQITALIGEETVYRYYEPVVGGIIPKFEAVI
jgi:hypothetical protein